MKTRLRSSLGFIAAVAACAALGVLLHASRGRAGQLRAALAALPQVSSPPAASAPAPNATTATEEDVRPDATTADQLAERTALLAAARRVPELARREAALRVITRIQAEHEAAPPAPRPLPPPFPRDAQYFSELLDDPEYLRLVEQNWRTTTGAYYEEKLARLGLPEETRRKVIELEFDSRTAQMDAQRYLRRDPAERAAAAAASRTLRDENNAAIQQLLGNDAFATYRDPTAGRPIQELIPSTVFNPLALRLSYSGAPLDPVTQQRLTALLQSMSSPAPGVPTIPRMPEFIERARSILQPGQMAALEELHAETEAARARRQLPKSSELPRTTRRERRDEAAR